MHMPDWTWSDDDEKVWAHVLILIGIAIRDRFHRRVESTVQRMLGDGSYDGFVPHSVKPYRTMVRSTSKLDKNKERPRSNANLDVLGCTVTLPAVENMPHVLEALQQEFGECVAIENQYDLTEEQAAEIYHQRKLTIYIIHKPSKTRPWAAHVQGSGHGPTGSVPMDSVRISAGHLDGEPSATDWSCPRRSATPQQPVRTC